MLTRVEIWNKMTDLGYTFDSSTGFALPNGAKRSPDVSWIIKDRWEALTQAEKEDFAPLCPDFCIELRSKTDRLNNIKAKLEEYIENGCRLGWLVDPIEKQVFIYRQDGSTEILKGFNKKLSGEDVLPGFEFDLNILEKG
ncbi:MAG: Uma2 family endonuclease [Saprospiraceae bacterium]|nr:Uma2 family endonuclease [Saprospiraceae bacterium]